jgi:hypothetical protein
LESIDSIRIKMLQVIRIASIIQIKPLPAKGQDPNTDSSK